MTRKETIFRLAKGFRGRAKNCFRLAIRRVEKGLQYAYHSRKLKKRLARREWITQAGANRLVVGSQARILYSDCEGRAALAAAFNDAIGAGRISAPVVLSRDHHDVSGTDSPVASRRRSARSTADNES